MSDVLSQAEVESLLNAMDGGPAPAAAPEPAAAPAAAAPAAVVSSSGPAALAMPTEKVTPYDFKRPERVGKDQMRALQTMYRYY